MSQYGNNIKFYRKIKNLTQNDLANLLHVSPQAVSKWENGQSEPDLFSLQRLAEIFEISVDELLKKDGTKVIEEKKEELLIQDLGICSRCYKPYGKQGLKEIDKKLVCYDCIAKEEKEKAEARRIKIQQENKIKEEKERRKSYAKKFIIGGIIGLIFLIISIIAVIKKPDETYSIGEMISSSIFTSILVTTFTTQLMYESKLKDILFNFAGRTLSRPGIIFSLDIGGILFFIFVKILFGILSLLFMIFVFLIGLAISIIISPITYLIDLIRFIKGKELI